MAENHDNDDIIDPVVKSATERANTIIPEENKLSWPIRLGMLLAAIIITANAALGIYNEAVINRNSQCTKQIVNVLATLRLSGSPTKQWIDGTLQIKSLEQLKELTKAYDQNDAAQKNAIEAQLSKTCYTPVKLDN